MSNAKIKIKLVPNGPARFETGSFEITRADGSVETKDAPFSLCRCGLSSKKPFCDGTHKESTFCD